MLNEYAGRCRCREREGGPSKKIWLDNIMEDMKEYKMTEDVAQLNHGPMKILD